MWIRFISVIVALVLIYSVMPNIITRVFHRWSVSHLSHQRCVALTFDDGPDPKYTGRLLDALKESGIPATFFVIGEKAMKQPELVMRMITEGHSVQIHGWRHDMVPALLPWQTPQQVLRTARVLEKRFSTTCSWYRPTWGLCNLMTVLDARVRRYRLILWSVMVGDWRVTEASVLLKRILAKLRGGDVIVLHDSDETSGSQRGAPESVIALIPMLADAVHERGLTFVTLNDQSQAIR